MSGIWRIIRFTKSLWRYYLVLSVLTILLSLMSQLQPLLTKAAVDQITKLLKGGHANVKLVALFAVLIFLTDLGQTIFSNISGYFGDVMGTRQQKILSQRYFQHMLELPLGYFDRELSGKIINRLNRGIDQVTNFMQMMSNNFLQFIFTTIFSLIVVAYYSWPVALMLLSLYPVFIILTIRTSGKWMDYQAEINSQKDIATGRFAESISQVRVVKSFLQEARELKFFNHRFRKIVATTKPQSRYWHWHNAGRQLILNLIFLAVFVFIFVETARGVYSLGTMVLLIQYATLIRIPLFTISFLVSQTQQALANTKDYFAAMDIKPEIVDRPGAKSLVVKRGDIAFNNVKFSYGEDKSVLASVNFKLAADSKIALVGESGEGKTTITSLLLRLYDLTGGQILIDGQNIAEVSQASLRANIGVVFQEPGLFSGTIRENIAYANNFASDEAVKNAARAANADEFISKFNKGYDSEIGERGLKLSGGQKQRIAIARALLKNAPILILDEATSSLDSKSEHMVQQALENLMKNRTTLIIAHRLSTIAGVDQIITLKNGRVDEQGAPSELAKSGGIYQQLLKLQNRHTEATAKKLKTYDIA